MMTMEMVFTAVYEEVPESEGGGFVAYTTACVQSGVEWQTAQQWPH
jgi:hypothetical protein